MGGRRLVGALAVLLAGGAWAGAHVRRANELQLGPLPAPGARVYDPRRGTETTERVLGDRKLVLAGATGELIDLAEERVYELDLLRKTYRERPFSEVRRRPTGAAAGGLKLQVDVTVESSGLHQSIAGHYARQATITVVGRPSGAAGGKPEQPPAVVLTAELWLADQVPAVDELAGFDERYARALGVPSARWPGGPVAFEAALAGVPGAEQLVAALADRQRRLEGSPVRTIVRLEVAEPEPARGVGGSGPVMEDGPPAPPPQARRLVFTAASELLEAAVRVDEEEVALPAGFVPAQ